MIKIRRLIWDEWNEDHAVKHGVSQEEIEEVCFTKHFDIKSGQGKIAVWGQSSVGRYVIIILGKEEYDGFYPISARDMEEKEKRFYKKWLKR